MPTPLKIALVSPAGPWDRELINHHLRALAPTPFSLTWLTTDQCPPYPFWAGSIEQRAKALNEALKGDFDLIWAVRGGYGSQQLLPHMDWSAARRQKPKIFLGFSDITALQNPLSQKLGWPCIHAPMPSSELWPEGQQDLKALLTSLPRLEGHLNLNEKALLPAIEGRLRGGCLSVLTNLLGTEWWTMEEGDILFFEDVGETVPKLLRMLCQWQQMGFLDQAKALVLGTFTLKGEDHEHIRSLLKQHLKTTVPIPVFTSNEFGHIPRNRPLGIGAQCEIKDHLLTWRFPYENIA